MQANIKTFHTMQNGRNNPDILRLARNSSRYLFYIYFFL